MSKAIFRSSFFVALLGIAFTSCIREKNGTEVSESSDASAHTSSPNAKTPVANLFLQLETERKNRPTETPKVETVAQAFINAGILLSPLEQALASTIHANYCTGTRSTDITISICEFESNEAAQRGKKYSEKMFAAIGPRTLTINQKTLLTLRPYKESDSIAHQLETMRNTFEKL